MEKQKALVLTVEEFKEWLLHLPFGVMLELTWKEEEENE